MNTFLHPLRTLGAALLLAAGLSACSTGTDSGDTNVERGTEKKALDPGAEHPTGGIDSARVQRDTAVSAQERLYDNARDRKDHDNDGKAD
ncbi:hypothetical protein LJ737_11080 [Hymenobacter sp. 15J16-1T3B]|uniref:hypothetical protein n=1 Tax=Hymenobacter sp. 15J16-1T3B TaxID=2886941 RepID=UPI001D110676|nr:hypothetical protein [Hymenobacter sp. 15J16-1T3B]MCC3157782.1 hypothetical protein [Hymenobacter sp. 15J16-1T3B]